MIHFIHGTLAQLAADYAVIDCGGVGFKIGISLSTSSKLSPLAGKDVLLYTYLAVSEDNMSLYGFFEEEEQRLFMRLVAISGIGPKAAVSILGTLSVQDLAFAIIAEDVKAITRAPGVGPKAAQRIILELKGKIDTQEAVSTSASIQSVQKTSLRADTEAVNALIALGASPSEAQKTVMQISKDGMSTEDIIKEALRRMSNGI